MKLIQKRDMIVVFIMVFLALVLRMGYRMYYKGKQPEAEIYYENRLIETIALDRGEERSFSFPQNKKVVFHLYEDGSICFEESDCPDQICVHVGRLHRVGESAACLPNGFILKIVLSGEQEEDGVDLIQ